jgi:RNA polymerase sigma-70 factor (ECF subfamily)
MGVVPRDPQDWAEISERLLDGDPAALLKVSRLITGFLVQMRAYDFREEWSDLTQDVLVALLAALRKKQVREPEAMVGYIRSITRNKFVNQLNAYLGRRETEDLDWPATGRERIGNPERPPPQETLATVRELLAKLPDKHRRAVVGVYGEGRTYEQVADETGIPLGSLKRYLREGLAALRRELSAGG